MLQDKENHICLYDCGTDTDVPPNNIQSYNDFKFKVTTNGYFLNDL